MRSLTSPAVFVNIIFLYANKESLNKKNLIFDNLVSSPQKLTTIPSPSVIGYVNHGSNMCNLSLNIFSVHFMKIMAWEEKKKKRFLFFCH